MSAGPDPEPVDVLVVGGGPAGLAAAGAAAAAGAGRVVVVEREDRAGGVPRHCHHTGFGLRDVHRMLTGPAYARLLVGRAEAAGVEVVTATMVTGWAGPGIAEVTGPHGRRRLRAAAVVLATGARERPRAARLVPGDRPGGVFTTGQLQQHVHVHHLAVGRRALVVGAEHVSYSALLTLRHGGARPVAMVTGLPASQTLASFRLAARLGLRVPLWTSTVVRAIHGASRVEAVELDDLSTGRTTTVAVDTVVFTGDWIPDHELARSAGLLIDRGTLGPAVDQRGRTTADHLFAAGNLVHPVETADVAARRGRRVGATAAAWLRDRAPAGPTVPVLAVAPLRWVAPNLVTAGVVGTRSMLLRTDEFLSGARLVVDQDGRRLAGVRLTRAVPNRSCAVPADWTAAVRADGGPVRVRVERA